MKEKITLTLDSSANFPRIRKLQDQGFVEITMVNYENGKRSKKAKIKQDPTAVWDSTSFDQMQWADEEDTVLEELKKLLGKINLGDCIQLEAHHKSGRDYFITEDRDDIISRGVELKELFGIKVLMPEELEELIKSL